MKPNIMTKFKPKMKKIAASLDKNSPKILLGMGISGGIITTIRVAKKAPKVKERLDDLHEQLAECDEELSKARLIFEDLKVAAPMYLPEIIGGGVSVGCILGSYKINAKRTAALATAYQIANSNLIEYKEKVEEVVGKTKKEKIESEIAENAIKKSKNLPVDNEVIPEDGKMLCYDKMSGRYFRSNPDEIRKAENKLNKRLITEMYVSLNDFYYEIGLRGIEMGDALGWNNDEFIDIQFNSILTDNDVPALVVDYVVIPKYGYENFY